MASIDSTSAGAAAEVTGAAVAGSWARVMDDASRMGAVANARMRTNLIGVTYLEAWMEAGHAPQRTPGRRVVGRDYSISPRGRNRTTSGGGAPPVRPRRGTAGIFCECS